MIDNSFITQTILSKLLPLSNGIEYFHFSKNTKTKIFSNVKEKLQCTFATTKARKYSHFDRSVKKIDP